MKKAFLYFFIVSLCMMPFVNMALAEEGLGVASLKDQKDAMKENAQQARGEEQQLKMQINQALQIGDAASAEQLKQQLKAVHDENVQQKQQDVQAFQASKQEFKQEVNTMPQQGNMPPVPNQQQGQQLMMNPPGPMGGPGRGPAMQGNPQGPKGGPGAGPKMNPPGPKGGPGAGPRKR